VGIHPAVSVAPLFRQAGRFVRLAQRNPLPSAARLRFGGHRWIRAMTHVHPKAIPNWCPQVNPDEAWTARCVKEKIAADGKRHRCQKKVGHDDNVHACQCGLEWKQW
jgi:hypothetical protein